MSKRNILITGGAGFIGSNLVEACINDHRIGLIRIIDNLSTGSINNILPFLNNPKVEFINADIRDYEALYECTKDIDVISHQAALGSVPRSVKNPLMTNDVNINGTINVFYAAKERGIKKVVYACSSSTYGDSKVFPRIEDAIGTPLSPYAVTKYVGELYAQTFSDLYDMDFVGLRYFNVFGPKQTIDGEYSAVIPKFIRAILNNEPPTIYGDGLQSRDFTYVDNIVHANLLAIFHESEKNQHQVYNIGCAQSTTVIELFETLCNLENSTLKPVKMAHQPGDVKNSQACIDKAKTKMGYKPDICVEDGLKLTLAWYKKSKQFAQTVSYSSLFCFATECVFHSETLLVDYM